MPSSGLPRARSPGHQLDGLTHFPSPKPRTRTLGQPGSRGSPGFLWDSTRIFQGWGWPQVPQRTDLDTQAETRKSGLASPGRMNGRDTFQVGYEAQMTPETGLLPYSLAHTLTP